jgi:hypothetical protein
VRAVRWRDFAETNPQLAEFVEERLKRAPCYFATVRNDGWPRVHPVGPLVPREGALCVSMYPTSPKGHDVRRTGRYALHCAVENEVGVGGEVLVTGTAVEAASQDAGGSGEYVWFELLVGEVRATTYDALGMNPTHTRWRAQAL